MPITPKGFQVMQAIDLDAGTTGTAADPKNVSRPINMSLGTHGWKIGLPRMLKPHRRRASPASSFIPRLDMQLAVAA